MSGKPIKTAGYAAVQSHAKMTPFQYETKAFGPSDVHIKIKYCGICHSDIHCARSEWHEGIFPMVPGHEIAGVVEAIGPNVKKFKKGDHVGVGYLVGCCRSCKQCDRDCEQYCPKMVPVFDARFPDGTPTYGGYGRDIVVDEFFVVRIPDNLGLDVAAPLLCAGITTYSPIKYFGLDKPGMKVGVVGFGGLGHMAVKFLKAFGCHVTVISRSYAKKDDAVKNFKVDNFVALQDPESVKACNNTLDGIVDTVSAPKDCQALLDLLTIDGKFITVGLPPASESLSIKPFPLIFTRKMIAGSLIGNMKEMQEMMDFCGEKNITCVVEKIPMTYVNDAWDRVVKGDVRYRFVMDIEGTAPKVE